MPIPTTVGNICRHRVHAPVKAGGVRGDLGEVELPVCVPVQQFVVRKIHMQGVSQQYDPQRQHWSTRPEWLNVVNGRYDN